MTLSDLLPEIHSLVQTDKLRLIQILAQDVAQEIASTKPQEEQVTAGWKDATVEIWSPYDASEAAQVLSQLLAADKAAGK